MTVPKSKVLSVSKGLMALADVKTGCPQSQTSQTVTVNITPGHATNQSVKLQQTDNLKARSLPPPRHPIIDGKVDPDITIVPSVKDVQDNTKEDESVKVSYGEAQNEAADESNPYANLSERDLATERSSSNIVTVEDATQDIQQLQALLKSKEDMALALTLMLNLVENNPLIVNKYIVAPEDVLCELIKLLTSASSVTIKNLIDEDVGCKCGAVKYQVIDKIYVEKDGDTHILKYSFPDATKLLDEHRISTKLVVNSL